jgi:hypothetical protein
MRVALVLSLAVLVSLFAGPSTWSQGAKGAPSLSGAAWWHANQARYSNSSRVDDLEDGFRKKVEAFLAALKVAGSEVRISTTRRSADRAYLMHSSCQIAHRLVKPLEVPQRQGVDIRWDHGDLKKSKEAAAEMVRLFGMKHDASLTSRHI